MTENNWQDVRHAMHAIRIMKESLIQCKGEIDTTAAHLDILYGQLEKVLTKDDNNE